SYSDECVRKSLNMPHICEKYKVHENLSPKQIAQYLMDGKVIGICRGRMEFGARALGNRSILADPSDPDNVRKINSQIKYRDFWMPFTPSVLAERANDYFDNLKGLELPFMTVGIHSKPLAQKHLIAALH